MDWHALWKDRMSHCSGIALNEYGGLKQWTIHGARTHLKGVNPKYVDALISKMGVASNDKVLDLGCGPGTLAIPLAKIVRSVTAVDMSTNMLKVLQERASAENLPNISCVNKQWRDVVVGSDIDESYDFVVSSNSFNMLASKETKSGGKICIDWDMIDAVKKMNAVGRSVYITMPFGERVSDIYEAMGMVYNPSPNLIVTSNVLYLMGIEPRIDILPAAPKRSSDPKRTLGLLEWKHKLTDAQRSAAAAKLKSIAETTKQSPRVFLLLHWRNK